MSFFRFNTFFLIFQIKGKRPEEISVVLNDAFFTDKQDYIKILNVPRKLTKSTVVVTEYKCHEKSMVGLQIIVSIIIISSKFFTSAWVTASLLRSPVFSILADLNNDVVWMVSISTPISNSSSLLSKPLGIVLNALITIGITVTFIFHCIFCSLARS